MALLFLGLGSFSGLSQFLFPDFRISL